MSDLRIAVIIPAAGQSTRFGGDKLGQDLGGRPLLLRTVEAFTKREEVCRIIVAAPPDSFDEFRARFGAQLGFHGAVIVEGGRSERSETVKKALEAVPDDATHVAIHDAARPGISDELLSKLFEAARVAPAVIPAEPIHATVKRVSEETFSAATDDAVADAILGTSGREGVRGRRVIETVPRTRLVAAQTPQIFEVALIRRAYAEVDPQGATDEASLVERLGESVLVLDGEMRNMKVTQASDLAIIRAIMGMRAPEDRPAHKRF